MFKELFEKTTSIKDMQKLLKKNGQIEIIMGDTDTWAIIDDIEDGYGYGMDQFDNDIEIDLKKDDYTITEDANLSKIAQAIKGKGLFDMDNPLRKAGFKTTAMGYSALKVTKGSSSYMIASEKNAEAGDGDITQDGYVIGVWK